jgi:hypothetical protein
MEAFDALPAAAREEIRHYGLSGMPQLLAMLRSEFTVEQFVERIRGQAAKLGMVREPDEVVRRKRRRL